MAKSWLKVISRLKRLIADIGPLWPAGSTELSGYAEDGPYHCEDCSFLKGKKSGNIFRDDKGKGRCSHPVVIADSKVKRDGSLSIVNIERGCCEFVDQHKSDAEKS
jgi:hypothetical protein